MFSTPLDFTDPSDVARTIQLAIAPVFLLTAIGAFLGVITTRLGRVLDRARALEAALPNEDKDKRAASIAELAVLDRRMVLANRSVGFSVASALIVCILITLLFLSAVSTLQPYQAIAILFIAALAFLIAALTSFAIEVRISIRTVRVRADLIRNAPRPPGDVPMNPFSSSFSPRLGLPNMARFQPSGTARENSDEIRSGN